VHVIPAIVGSVLLVLRPCAECVPLFFPAPAEEALALLHEALRVCYYRDKQSINKFTVSKVCVKVV